MAKTKLGKVSLTPKGEWDSATAYEQLDLVSYGGSSWVAKKSNTNVAPRENDCWMLVAEKGEQGDTGSGTTYSTYVVPRSTSGTIDTNMIPLCPWSKGDMLAFLPPENNVWEQTIDGGETWTVVSVSDSTKRHIFGGKKKFISCLYTTD